MGRFRGLLLLVLVAFLLPGPGRAAPPDLPVTPGAGETVAEARPVICVQLPADGSVRFEGARLWVNDREVTGSCLRTPMFVSYQAPSEMAAGPVQVRFTARTAGGQPLQQAWGFQVCPTCRITSLSHDAQGELGQYDDLTVDMVGEPHGKAWFEIEGLRDEVPMEEVATGHYRGTYRVQPGDYRLFAPVIGHLALPSGTSTMKAEAPASIFGQLFRVRILEPANGAQVPLSFMLRGRTRPHARVSVTPKFGFNEAMTAPTRDNPKSETGSIPGEADADGNFEVKLGFPIKLPNMFLAITVVATDEEGNRSVPTTLRLRF